jgi:hypothetical protein
MKICGGFRRPADHWSNYFSAAPTVTLDGKPIDHVVAADDAAGYVIVNVYENGKPKVDRTALTLVTERLDGKVELIGQRHKVAAA